MHRSDLQKDPLRRPQKNIRTADRLRIADKGYAAIFHLGNLIAQIHYLFF